jgi:hypothetical protein
MRHFDSISGNGKIMESLVCTDTVNTLQISEKLDLLWIPSDSNKVILRADENLHDNIRFDYTDKKLIASSDKYIRMAKAKQIVIYSNTLRTLKAGRKATIDARDSLCLGTLSLTLGTGGEARLVGAFDSLDITSATGSVLHLGGQARAINISANSGSEIFGYDLHADEAHVKACGASDIHISILRKAWLEAGSMSDIIYRGDPIILSSQTTGFADIKKKNPEPY